MLGHHLFQYDRLGTCIFGLENVYLVHLEEKLAYSFAFIIFLPFLKIALIFAFFHWLGNFLFPRHLLNNCRRFGETKLTKL